MTLLNPNTHATAQVAATERPSAHTPGPWQADLINGRVVISQSVGKCETVCAYPATREFIDNARLISAAPTLLEALKEISNRDPVGGTCSAECTCIGCIARQAISKAEGQ